jgi:pimeloyl-ACP methyl ester carboxylesterase
MFTMRLIRSTRLRSVLIAAAVCSASLAVLPASAQSNGLTSHARKAEDSGTTKPTVVLVHGAWADGSSWSGVISGLQEKGYTVVAPPNPLRSLKEDSGYLASFLTTIPGPIVLVGHSYGGSVITNAATGNANVRALVYVDAFIPVQGENITQEIGSQSCLSGSAIDPTKVFNFVQDPALPAGDYDTYLKLEATSLYPGFGTCFAGGFSADKTAELAAAQRGLTLGAITDPSGVPAWMTIRSWDLIGTADKLIPEAQQLSMARRANAHIREFDAPHAGLISEPDAVVNVILNAIHATS